LVDRDDVENQASLSVSVLEDTTDTSARLGRTPNQLFDNASPSDAGLPKRNKIIGNE